MVLMRNQSFPLPTAKPVLIQARMVLPIQGSRPWESPRHLAAAWSAAHPAPESFLLPSVSGTSGQCQDLLQETCLLTGKPAGELGLCFPNDVKGRANPPVPRASHWPISSSCFPHPMGPPSARESPQERASTPNLQADQSLWVGPLGRTARYPKVAKSDPGPEAVNTTLSCFTAGLLSAFAALVTLQEGGAAPSTNPFGPETLF